MRRTAAAAAAVIGGAMGSIAATVAVVVGLYSVLWIFVFGDDPWPEWARTALDLAIPVLGILLWIVLALLIWNRLRPRTG